MKMKSEEVARVRHDTNKFSSTNKPLDNEAEALGLAGELAMANLLRIVHRPQSAAPTRGYQFNLGPNKRIKVVTSKNPLSLLVKEGKVTADVYVLARCVGDPVAENVDFVGWASAKEVRSAPTLIPTSKGGYTQPAHKIPAADLGDMKYFMHGMGMNPDELNRFPLSKNGEYIVEAQEIPPVKQGDYKPLPIKQRVR
jgi:hypothetical protein